MRPAPTSISLRAALRLAELTTIARAKAADLTLPTLVFASERDTVASFAVTADLFRALDNARLVLCNRSNHIVTYDFDRELVATEVLAFLTRRRRRKAAPEQHTAPALQCTHSGHRRPLSRLAAAGLVPI